MRALVVEPQGDRGSLTVTRALAAAGWTVGVATTGRKGLADASRSATRRHVVGAPADDLGRFLAATAAAVREGGYELVLPGAGDSVQLALSLGRDEIPARLALPGHDRVIEATDKLGLAEAGRRAGLSVPHTAAADERTLAGLRFPAVVKERLHQDPTRSSATPRLVAAVVASPRQARVRIETIRAAGGTPVLQEMVQGRLAAFALVADREGRIVARAQQLCERTWPPAAGVSARARTVAIDRSLEERVGALVRELGWFGLAEVQFMLSGDGEYRLIDFNGRTYGSVALAVAAGANLPAIWAGLAIGRRPDGVATAAAGQAYQWAEGDLRAALAQRSGRIRRLWDCLRYARGATSDVWAPADPRPAARYLRLRLARVFSRALSARASPQR